MLQFDDLQSPKIAVMSADGIHSSPTSPTHIRLERAPNQLAIFVASPAQPLSRVVLRWPHQFPSSALYLGDHWERGYGDLQWRHLQPQRVLPWYFLAHDPARAETVGLGVKVQPNALCFWTVDDQGISLWLDLRNGTGSVDLGTRELHAATVVSTRGRPGESPFSVARRFCQIMCPNPRLPRAPVAGNNNWYYAYGEGFEAQTIQRDAAFLAELAGSHPNRPFCTIDAGWSPGSVCPGGPWTAGRPDTFPDMPALAARIKALGVRPGIWIRPTALTTVDNPARLRPGYTGGETESPLDLSLPENLACIADDIARLRHWGYELIKHDFSTYDAFGQWGFQMGASPGRGQWRYRDTSLTNAEIILRLYRTLRDAASDAYLLGCNTIGHLGAGLFEIQRTGDDTSGRVWERTRRMGVNTLAFRLPQHNTFFAADADCTPHTEKTPWDKNRQWLDLVARSGSPLFISVDPTLATGEIRIAFKDALQLALSGGEPGGIEPLDWLTNTCPNTWRLGSRTAHYSWTEPLGPSPLDC